MGKAPDPWQILVSTQSTASAPSQVVGIPGYSNFGSSASSTGTSVVRSQVVVAMGPPPLLGKESAAARIDLCSGRMPSIVIDSRDYSKENPPQIKGKGHPADAPVRHD